MTKKRSKKKDLPIAYRPLSPEQIVNEKAMHGLADSGARTSTVTGALREPTTVDAGRYDLIPGECVGQLSRRLESVFDFEELQNAALALLADGDLSGVVELASHLVQRMGGLHRLAVHYARGALKYADRNWEKGLETGRCVDSLMRHIDKARRGLTDEDHEAAVLWNCFALMFTEARLCDGRFPKELDTYGLVK